MLVLILALFSHAGYQEAAKQAVALEAKYGIEAELVLAIIKVESNFNVKAVGRSHGEVGLMQLRPNYFPGVKFDVKSNIEVGVRHLSAIRQKCVKKYGKAWYVCYNIGQNRRLNIEATDHPYYKKVKAAYGKEKYFKKTAANLRDSLRISPSKSQNYIVQAP